MSELCLCGCDRYVIGRTSQFFSRQCYGRWARRNNKHHGHAVKVHFVWQAGKDLTVCGRRVKVGHSTLETTTYDPPVAGARVSCQRCIARTK